MTNLILKDNLILDVDSYKHSHFLQLPPDVEYMTSYIEARGPIDEESVFFGLQMFIKRYLLSPITREMIIEANEFNTAHGEPFNLKGWEHILYKHNGFLPIRIQALPEGTVANTKIPQVQITNTDPVVPWLTNFVETALLRGVWYPSSVATNSRNAKKAIMKALNETCDDPEGQINFKLHDFGARGVSSKESAGIGGIAHLVNFMGTDTQEALRYGRAYYNEHMAGFSIPASEHFISSTWGK